MAISVSSMLVYGEKAKKKCCEAVNVFS